MENLEELGETKHKERARARKLWPFISELGTLPFPFLLSPRVQSPPAPPLRPRHALQPQHARRAGAAAAIERSFWLNATLTRSIRPRRCRRTPLLRLGSWIRFRPMPRSIQVRFLLQASSFTRIRPPFDHFIHFSFPPLLFLQCDFAAQ